MAPKTAAPAAEQPRAVGTTYRSGPSIPRALTPEARLAEEFLGMLTDNRRPWAESFAPWAAEKNLSPDLARRVRITVLRLRMFGALERGRRRPA